MSGKQLTTSEYGKEVQSKLDLISAAKVQKKAAEEVIASQFSLEPKHTSYEEHLRIEEANKNFQEATRVIEQETAALQKMENSRKELLKTTKKTRGASLSSVHSAKRKNQIDKKERLMKLQHQHDDAIEELDFQIGQLKLQSQTKKTQTEVAKLELELKRLESNFLRKQKQIEEEAAIQEEKILVEEEEQDLDSEEEKVASEFQYGSDDGTNYENVNEQAYYNWGQDSHAEKGAAKDDMMMTLMQGQLKLQMQQNAFMEKASVPSSDKYLPEFSGDPAHWGNFKSSYERSATRFKLDDGDNLSRLQRALKGKARDAVNHLLANEKNVPHIMKTLELRFGRAEFILDHLVEKVKAAKKPDANRPDTVVEFGTLVEALVTNIDSYNKPAYFYNVHLVNELVEKLPGEMKRSWAVYLIEDDKRDNNLKYFSDWVTKEVRAALLLVKPTSLSNVAKSEERGVRETRKRFGAINAAGGEEGEISVCLACSRKGHNIDNCWSLRKKKLDERWKIVKDARVCYSCLKPGHITTKCSEAKECGIDGCKRRHHKLLHSSQKLETPDNMNVNKEKSNDNTEDVGTVGVSVSIIKGTDGPLPIVAIRVKGTAGTKVVYALLDSGATRTMVSENLAKELKMVGTPVNYSYRTVSGQVVVAENAKKVKMIISGRYRKAKEFPLTDVITVPKIELAPYSIDMEAAKQKWPHLRQYQGPSLLNVTTDIVIGGDHGYLLMHRRLLYTTPEEPVAMRTILGWVIMGKLGNAKMPGTAFAINGILEDDRLDKLIMESFKLNDYFDNSNSTSALSVQDKKALDIMEKTAIQRKDNRWEIGLLWKDETPFPENTYDVALSRLQKIERRLSKDRSFSEMYEKKFEEYATKEYIRKLSKEEAAVTSGRTCYIPHFGVFNQNKPGKFRLVFDCAAETNGKSFNDKLLTGPDFMKLITSVMWNFRRHVYVICGDIEDMFHRIYIREQDREAQRFLWRDGKRNEDPDVYEMQVMIFGATSSPSSAIFIKDKNARKFGEKFPEAVTAITEHMFMDDCCTGSNTVEGAVRLRKEITEICSSGGFVIKKWMSNNEDIINSVPEQLRLPVKDNCIGRRVGETERVLGMYWDPVEDEFTFRLNFAKVDPGVVRGRIPTKREMCSLVMSLFDPLGFVGNYRIKGMILFQQTWKSGIGWDDEIPMELYQNWKSWINDLESLKTVRIPRCYSVHFANATVQLHTLVDASAEATCAICYFRIEWQGVVELALIGSRTHVAPTKKSTIPRLELCAALHGSKLARKILNELKIEVSKCVFWSDSVTALCWISSDANRYKEYVANRVEKIRSLTNSSDWRWVGTADNVADDGTRFQGRADFSDESRWLRGPAFLKMPEESWPTHRNLEGAEGAMCAVVGELVQKDTKNYKPDWEAERETTPIMTRFSCFYRLCRATAAFNAAALFWLAKTRKRSTSASPFERIENVLHSRLSSEEILGAKLKCIRIAQGESRVVEIMEKSRKLQYITDSDGIIRVVGRLENAGCVDVDARNPVLLPSQHWFVNLIVDAEHRKNGHVGRNTVYNSLRERFWIQGGRNVVRRAWSRCYYCKLIRAKPVAPMMGVLPSQRLAGFQPPFTYTGCDLFGPIEVTVGRRHEKRWGLLFTCMVTRGIHLEVLSGLSADETLMGISRFVDSRGVPCHMYSDNGTNFRAAAKVLHQRQKFLGLSWHFTPPASPHMGGAWETLVKQVKKGLSAVLKDRFPKDQCLLTAIKAVEKIVNSRPLAYVSSDEHDATSLTPNHFLRGIGVASPKGADITGSETLTSTDGINEKWAKDWERAQIIANDYWTRWSKEVLPNLLLRDKWNTMKDPIRVGELVVMVDEVKPRREWSKALVSKLHPGKDGITRVVDVTVRKFKNSEVKVFRRAVAKVCRTGIVCSDLSTITVSKSGGRNGGN